MTKDERETLRQLEREATKGPWKVDTVYNAGFGRMDPVAVVGNSNLWAAAETLKCDDGNSDAALIAALRTHATDLLDAHERLEQVREWMVNDEGLGALIEIMKAGGR